MATRLRRAILPYNVGNETTIGRTITVAIVSIFLETLTVRTAVNNTYRLNITAAALHQCTPEELDAERNFGKKYRDAQ